MTNISAYIETLRKKKIPDQKIRQQLIAAGWPDKEIDEALDQTDELLPPPPPYHPVILHNDFGLWITFEYILMFISLYVMAISLGVLLYQYIDVFIPKSPLISSRSSIQYFTFDNGYTIRNSLAALIVSWPIFSLLFLRSMRKIQTVPAIRTIRSRKLLIYITMIITFIIALTNMVQVVYNFINGTVTLNFLGHIGVIFIISSTIFGFLFNEVKHDRKLSN